MDSAFVLKLALSFVIGGVWVMLASVIAEQFGTKLGGVISGIPTTIAVALLFIGIFQGPQSAAAATTIIPAAFAVSCVFMVLYTALVGNGLVFAIATALAVWFCLQFLLVRAELKDFGLSLLICGLALTGAIAVYERILCIRFHERTKVKYSVRQLLLRAVFAGAMVAFAVLMSRIGGPLWGGVFASFPAMFISTLVITYHSVSPEFSRSIGKTHMISGVVNCVIYAAAVRYSYPNFGLAVGTVVSLVTSGGSSYLTWLFVNRMTT